MFHEKIRGVPNDSGKVRNFGRFISLRISPGILLDLPGGDDIQIFSDKTQNEIISQRSEGVRSSEKTGGALRNFISVTCVVFYCRNTEVASQSKLKQCISGWSSGLGADLRHPSLSGPLGCFQNSTKMT